MHVRKLTPIIVTAGVVKLRSGFTCRKQDAIVEFCLMEDVLKYGLLLIGNLIAFAGAWLVSFTETDEVTQRKRLTKWGKWTLPIAVILLVAGFWLTVINDRESAQKARLAQKTAQE